MRFWLGKHRILRTLLWTLLALTLIEVALVYCYMDSWVPPLPFF